MSCGVGRRHGSDPVLLWLWLWPAATAAIRPLAWEPPYAAGADLKKKKEFPLFGGLGEIPLYLFTTFCLSICLSMGTRVASHQPPRPSPACESCC